MPNNHEIAKALNEAYSDTIVNYNGVFSYITSFAVSQAGAIHVSKSSMNPHIASWEENKEKVDIDNLKIEFPPVGYINYKNNINYAVFIKRVPRRQWKKGLHLDNISFRIPLIKDMGMLNIPTVERENAYNVNFIHSWFLNTYPSILDAHALVETGEFFSCAFSNKFALSNSIGIPDIFLLYKEYIVGFFSPTDEIMLYSKFSLLREELEVFGKVALFNDISEYRGNIYG